MSANVVPIRPFIKLELIGPRFLRGAKPPERMWIVPDWIPYGVVTGLYGDGGLGKSLLALQLQTCTALGRPWLGLPVQKVASLGIFCEDSRDEILRRQDEINAAYGCSPDDLDSVHWMPRLGEDNLLMTFSGGVGSLTPFHEQVTQAALDVGARLVVVDTAADVFAGNENDRGQVRQFISRALGSIAIRIKGAVVLCAHPSRSGLSSGEGDGGSTGWSNSLRSRLFLSAPAAEDGSPDVDARILQRRKANYAARHDEIRAHWKNGVIVPDIALPSGAEHDRRPAKDVFLALLDERNATERPVSENSRASNFAPKAFSELPADKRDHYTARHFKTALESLFATGEIVVESYGRKSDMRKKIVRPMALAMAA
jgi:RecA-family ATPase